MYLLTKECSAFLSEQAKFMSDFWTVILFFQSDMFVRRYICLEYSYTIV
jgi:hypothetical protein